MIVGLRIVGTVALAGISTVAAYILFYRKKEEVTADEPMKDTLKAREPVNTKDNDTESQSSKLMKEEPTLKLGTLEENNTNYTPTLPVEKKNNEEVEDLASKTESLMEWIDRQLKEAESTSRNGTPDPEIRTADVEIAKHALSTSDINGVHGEEMDIISKHEPQNSEASICSLSETAPVTSNVNNTMTKKDKEVDDSLEILEFEAESVTIPEKTTSNVQQLNETEFAEPQQLEDEEEQSIEIINIKEPINVQVTPTNAMSEIESKQVNSINSSNVLNEEKHTNEAVHTSSIEFIDAKTDINKHSVKEAVEASIQNKTASNCDLTGKISELPPERNGLTNNAESSDTKSVNFRASAICKKVDDENSDAEIQLLKEDNNKRNSTILEDSDFSENDSESGSSVESVNTEVTVDEAKSDEDLIKESKDEKKDVDDSIGLMLRPSWQLKNPQNTLNKIDEKLTSL